LKFKLNRTGKKLDVPDHVLRISGLSDDPALEIHAFDGAIVITKAQMTAMDIITLTGALQNLSADLHVHLAKACGKCDECGLCAAFDEDDEKIILPPHILEEAGLPPGCKLTADVDEDGNISVFEAGYEHDLSDVPASLLDCFREAGVCMTELEERLMTDDIVYGGKYCAGEF